MSQETWKERRTKTGGGRERGRKIAAEDGVRNIGTFWYRHAEYQKMLAVLKVDCEEVGTARDRRSGPFEEAEKGAKRAGNAKRK